MSEKLYEVDLAAGLGRLSKHDDLLRRLNKHIGADTYVVGGPVRDALLGRESKDIDVVTIGNHEHMDRFEKSGAKRIKQDFPVFSHPDFPGVEVAFGRKERKTGVGHSGFDWDLAPDLATDLARRDFTINAMAYHPDKGIVDPLGGMDHLNKGILSATSDAFKDDPLRILRGARFASQLGMTPDEKTVSLMKGGASELHTEPKERVRGEFEKSLSTANPDKFFRTLDQGNSLHQWFPEISALKNAPAGPEKYHPEGSAFEHTMLALKAAADLGHTPTSKLLTLVHDTGKAETPKEQWPKQTGHEAITKPGVDLVNRLELGTGTAKNVATHILNHMVPHGAQRPGMVGHRPGTIVSYFDKVKRIIEPHLDSVVADASGKGKGPVSHPYVDNYRKLFNVYKGAGNEPDMTLDQRKAARTQAVAGVMNTNKIKEAKEPAKKKEEPPSKEEVVAKYLDSAYKNWRSEFTSATPKDQKKFMDTLKVAAKGAVFESKTPEELEKGRNERRRARQYENKRIRGVPTMNWGSMLKHPKEELKEKPTKLDIEHDWRSGFEADNLYDPDIRHSRDEAYQDVINKTASILLEDKE